MSNAIRPLRQRLRRGMHGTSLIITLIMLVVIAFTAVASIRNATSSERMTNNVRMQSLAQQYSEAALRYCEDEMSKTTTARISTLADTNILLVAATDPVTAQHWENTTTWVGTGGASASKTTVPSARLTSVDSSFTPATAPECVVERQALWDGGTSYVITSRGFSPDYRKNSAGATTSGAVVWLQSIVFLN